MELTTKNWKEFRIEDLFDYERGKEAAPNQNQHGECPLISETQDNNGFVRLVEPTKVIDGHCLTVSVNFASTVFCQEKNFCASVNIIILRPKSEMIKKQLLFIGFILSKKHKVYSYTDKVSKALLMKETLLLPSKNDEPDWGFMEEFIKEIEEKYIENIDKYNQENIDKALSITGLTMVDLDDDLKVEPADRYEEFRVGDLFDGLNGDFDIKQEHINNKGDIVITSGVENFGILGKTDIKARLINEKTLTIDMFGNVFYRPYKYKMVTHARVFALIPKFDMSNQIGLFMTTVFFYLKEKYSYSNMCSFSKIKNEKIKLPAIDKDTPDFDYMEKAIYIY